MQLRFRVANYVVLIVCSIPQEMRASRRRSNHLTPVHLVLWSCKFPQCGHIPVLYYDHGINNYLQINRSSLRTNRLKFKTTRELPIILEGFNIPQFNKRKPQDVNMPSVGLANTKFSTGYCPKISPITCLIHNGEASRASIQVIPKVEMSSESCTQREDDLDWFALHPWLAICLNQGLGQSAKRLIF